MPKDYLEPEDLLTDKAFLSWYFGPGREADRFWNGWAERDQARRVVLEQAVALLEMTRLPEKGRTGAEIEGAADALMRRIGTAPEPSVGTIRAMRTRRWVAAACVLVVVTGGMMAARIWWGKPAQIATAFGEVNLRTLPDGSEVTMNANSRLRLSSDWQAGRDREVWIDGEAFFHVQKTAQRSRFIVHTNRLDIIVTGTQFNVVNRDGKENVMLREGRVIVHPVAGGDVGRGDLAMVPGDFVQWKGKGLEKGSIKSDSLLAWKQHQLLFDNTPLKDVVGIIKDQYGVQIELEDQSIADSTISGIVRNDNLDVFLQALETTSDFQVIRKDGKIAIKASTKP